MKDIIIDIKADFSDSPGARYRKDGPHSGEEFFEVLLKPKFEEAVRNKVNSSLIWMEYGDIHLHLYLGLLVNFL